MAIATRPGYQTGVYLASFTTGVLAATLAADAPIAGIRCGPTQSAVPFTAGLLTYPRFVYIEEISPRFSGVVAFTAAQQFGFYVQRFSGANLAGGAAAAIMKVNETGAPLSVALSGGAEGGDTRVATTAALTTAGVAFDGSKIPVDGFAGVGPAEVSLRSLSFNDNPLRLGLGEGLAIQNLVGWPAAGTGIVTGWVRYSERSA